MPDISTLTNRPGLTHCRTCSSRLVNPVYKSATEIAQEAQTDSSRFCYEIIERVNDLPAFPEKLTLVIHPTHREINLISHCTRAGGSWLTTDVLTRAQDDQGSWIWAVLTDLDGSGLSDDDNHDGMARQTERVQSEGKGEAEFGLGRPRWVQKVPRPVYAIVLHKLEGSKKGVEYDVELVFDERERR